MRVDGRPLRRTIVLARGDDGHVDFDLIVHPTGAVSAVLAFTLGGVALVVGGISGADALARSAAIKTRCPGGHCPAGEEQAVSSARGIADLSTGAFVVAGAAAAGTALYVIRPGGAAPAPVEVTLGPGSLQLSGRF